MKKHEKKAFLKFFFTYFGSVALLILVSGFFYFTQEKNDLLEREHYSMIEYARSIKMNLPSKNKSISHEIKNINIKNFSMDNFKIKDSYFYTYIPHTWNGGYMLIKKPTQSYDAKLLSFESSIISLGFFLLFIFAMISYFLSFKALEPMQEAIYRVDNFSKDLIHDLNTPITSILLNMRLLKKDRNFDENKHLKRIKQSVDEINSLHKNLSILLKENNLILEKIDIYIIINQVVDIYQKLYPSIIFEVQNKIHLMQINEEAFKQIISNILSNACKYSKENPKIKIFTKENILNIQDNGIGIKNPNSVFERNYKEHQSGNGIGLDITKRLCDAMKINIKVSSIYKQSSTFSLTQ